MWTVDWFTRDGFHTFENFDTEETAAKKQESLVNEGYEDVLLLSPEDQLP